MSTPDQRFHETWMGMVQPIEGLVVSIPALLQADIAARKPAAFHEHFRKAHVRLPRKPEERPRLRDVRAFFEDVLEVGADLRDYAPPKELSLYVAEGKETIRPSWAIRAAGGKGYQLLAMELPPEVDLDKPDTREGKWAYPPRAKLDRLLRHAGVPIGLLTNQHVIRLVYAPVGESTGSIAFRIADMEKVDGRPILDALVMLLHARRFEGAGEGRSLAELLAKSREFQAEVSKELEAQVKEALERLLRGFEEAAERDGAGLLSEALADGTLTQGLLTLLLRLVFVLFAEDRELLPIEHAVYREGMSVLGLFERLQADAASYPDSMSRRFGAYGRLVALFRAVFLGVHHRDLVMPPRRGDLFDPHRFPFLEGWGPAGGAPITLAEDRTRVRIPSVDDGCIFEVLHKLLYLKRERLSYRALDVEQIGSVYEGLIAYGVQRLAGQAVRLGPHGVWIEAAELLAEKASSRAKWLKERTNLSASKCEAIAAAVAKANGEDEAFATLAGFVKDPLDQARAGRLVLQPGPDRKHTSSHYTPRSLSEPIVEKTLRPLLTALGEAPPAERILSLKVCDPAMGSGAFLVAACRFLAGEVVAAWTRKGVVDRIATEKGDVVTYARRLVAQRCLYGVDKNPFAVSLGKLSLWLATLAKDEPFTFIDHALRCGDSLVGLSFEQIEKFTWEPLAPKPEANPKQRQLALDFVQDEIAHALKEALAARQRIEALADDGSIASMKERERLLDDATDALGRVRVIGDLVVGAFFAHDKPKDRENERKERERRVRTWLGAGGPVPEDLCAMADEARAKLRPLHWPVEFPEIFFAERPDPLEQGAVNRIAQMDAFVGNPPFASKNAIVDSGGDRYVPWLLATVPGAHGNADLSGYFFRRADALLGRHGTAGMIATNTIAQGDTRLVGLQWLLRAGLVIYDATPSMTWPGEEAAVHVSVVHVAKGAVVRHTPSPQLVGVGPVSAINSRLRAGPERPDPTPLPEMKKLRFMGAKIYGSGFILEPAEQRALVAKNPRNRERIFTLIGGEDVNTSAEQTSDRFVIDFGQRTLNEAAQWPDLLEIVRERVKPERDTAKESTADGAHRKKYWWQFAQPRPELKEAIQALGRCLVTAAVTKHLVFSFQPTDRVFAHTLYVFALESWTSFAVLQARVHECWARLLSSSMKSDLRYAASDCFDPYPHPMSDPTGVMPALESAGMRFYEARAAYMNDEDIGLTSTYNRMKDPEVTDARVEELRELTIAMDRAVLAAYGWSDLEPPPFTTPVTDDEKRVVSLFEDAVIDRLFALNAERAKAQAAAPSRRASAGDEDDEPTSDEAPVKSGRTTNPKAARTTKKKRLA